MFLSKMWIKWWSSERKIILKTPSGDKLIVSPEELKKMNLKMKLVDTATRPGRSNYQVYMVDNKPRRAENRIPLLAISNKLQRRIGRTSIDVREEYRKRGDKGYRYWEPGTNGGSKAGQTRA